MGAPTRVIGPGGGGGGAVAPPAVEPSEALLLPSCGVGGDGGDGGDVGDVGGGDVGGGGGGGGGGDVGGGGDEARLLLPFDVVLGADGGRSRLRDALRIAHPPQASWHCILTCN